MKLGRSLVVEAENNEIHKNTSYPMASKQESAKACHKNGTHMKQTVTYKYVTGYPWTQKRK
jgi:hypothetical protein